MKLYPDDLRARLTTAVAIAACLGAAMMLGPMVGINGVWPFLLATVVGIVLGPFVGRLLFQPSSARPPDHPPQA